MPTTTFLESGTAATQDLTFYPNQFVHDVGSADSVTDQFHTGTRSLKLVTTQTGDGAIVASADGAAADAGTRCSFWVRLAALPTTHSSPIFAVYQTGFGNGVFLFALTTGGLLMVASEGPGILGTGSHAISAATWTRIAFSYVITSGTSWSLKTYVNGTLDLTLTQTAGTLTSTGGGQISPTLTSDASAGLSPVDGLTVWYSDIYVDNGSDLADPGDMRVTAKRPIANGMTNGFTTQIGAGGSGTGTGHSPQVNEQPLSQTNGWSMVGAGSAVTEEYNVQSVSAGDVDITGQTIVDWMGWVFAKSLASETASIVVGGVSSNIALTSTPTAFFQAKGSTTYPAGSGTDVGIVTSTTVTTVSLYECGVLVAYTPSTGTTLAIPAGAAKFVGQAPWSLVEDTYVPHLIIKNRLAP